MPLSAHGVGEAFDVDGLGEQPGLLVNGHRYFLDMDAQGGKGTGGGADPFIDFGFGVAVPEAFFHHGHA